MDEDHFWAVIAAAYRANDLDHAEAVAAELGRLPWFAVVAFQARLDAAAAAADRPALRAAAALIQGADSAAAFADFRAWLVGRGRAVYAAALADPDTLADVLDGDPVDGCGLPTAARRAYEAKTGMSDFTDQLARARLPAPPGVADGAVPRRFPRLEALYPAGGGERGSEE